MKEYFHNFQNFLNESKTVYNMELEIKAEKGAKFYGQIFEAIRGIEGVTVIRASEAIRKDEQGNKIMKMTMRFYIHSQYVRPYISKIKDVIRSLKDEEGKKIISVITSKLPREFDLSKEK